MIQIRNTNRNCTRHESMMILVITILVGMILSIHDIIPSSSTTILYVNGQEIWNGCIDPSKNKQQNLIRIQQPTRVCLSIANDTNWNSGNTAYIRASFEPKADVYSRFHIPNSYRDLVQRKSSTTNNDRNIFANSKTITLSTTSQTAFSFLRVYYDQTQERVYPFITAIMNVKKGVIDGITWDDACVFCGGTECLENTYNYNGIQQNKSSAGQNTRSCFIKREDCDDLIGSNSSSTVCDITLYTVWTGTDANGIALQSQAYRFSAFPAQELSDRLSQLLIPDGVADTINNNNNNNKNSTNRILSQHQLIDDHYHDQSQLSSSSSASSIGSAVIHEDGDL